MLKKIGFTTAALFGLLLLGSARPAKAEVHFGIYLGAPAYSYPVDPYAYSYPSPYDYTTPYGYAAPAYVYPAPRYVVPRWNVYRDRDRHEWRERERHREHELREHRDRR